MRAAVILAAGASERMGTPKAILAWRDTTLLDCALREAGGAGVKELVVVLGPATRHLRPEAMTVVNSDPQTGRSASIRLGAAALPESVEAIVIQSVDQPVPATVLVALFDAIVGSVEVAVPTYRGRRGHPVAFSGRLLSELRAVGEEEAGLRAVVRRHRSQLREVAVDDEAVIWNLNDPAAYAAARAAVQP
jgi:molybdenum cofactor cytidylyltransferase